jgi:DNA-directed RNA polymerase subunit RPC12/RpoP
MDLIFKCIHCDQELAVNPAGAGTEIECPTCGQAITIPDAEPQNIRTLNPISSSAAAKEVKHFAVPVRSTPTEMLIKKQSRRLDVPAQDGKTKIRIRTIKRTECLEVGHDKFDEHVSAFLGKFEVENIISVTPITYSHFDLNNRQNMTDYGVIIIFKA